MKRFSESCVKNSSVIFETLDPMFAEFRISSVFEIASGTGQHACYFGHKFSEKTWQTSDLDINHAGISAWIDDEGLTNVAHPTLLDLNNSDFKQTQKYDSVFSANMLHIVPEELANNFFKISRKLLRAQGLVFIYGPFKFNSEFTSSSNADFDIWLKTEVSTKSGVRDIEQIDRAASNQKFHRIKTIDMPANNHLVVYQLTS